MSLIRSTASRIIVPSSPAYTLEQKLSTHIQYTIANIFDAILDVVSFEKLKGLGNFSITWETQFFYAFPPFSLISHCLIMIVPFRLSSHIQLVHLILNVPRKQQVIATMLKMPGKEHEFCRFIGIIVPSSPAYTLEQKLSTHIQYTIANIFDAILDVVSFEKLKGLGNFSITWETQFFYAFPPFSLISHCLIMIVPFRLSSHIQLVHLILNVPRKQQVIATMLKMPGKEHEFCRL